MDEAVVRAKERLEQAAEGRVEPAAVDAALERTREALESLSQTTAELQAGLPGDIQEGLREQFRPSARHLAEVRGLQNQVIRRLERLEVDLRADAHGAVAARGLRVYLTR